jgi:hypothetical protein
MNATTARLLTPASLVVEQAQALRRHLQQCQAARSQWFRATAWAELVHSLVAPRIVTTVSLAAVLLLACTW